MEKLYQTGQSLDQVPFSSTLLQLELPRTVCEEYKKKLINQTWKLIPLYEEGGDWRKQIQTLLIDFRGIFILLDNVDIYFITACVKLTGLSYAEDFMTYRRTVFDIIDAVGRMYDE